MLDLEGIGKRFDGTTALAGASLRVRRGTVHALLGENGAGKTMLVRIAYGLLRPDEGVVLVVVDGHVRPVARNREAVGRAMIGVT